MKQFNYVITDEVGLHARPAGLLVKKAKEIESKITVSCNGKSVDATKLLAILSMAVKKGMEVTVSLEGDNEEADAAAMELFFKGNF